MLIIKYCEEDSYEKNRFWNFCAAFCTFTPGLFIRNRSNHTFIRCCRIIVFIPWLFGKIKRELLRIIFVQLHFIYTFFQLDVGISYNNMDHNPSGYFTKIFYWKAGQKTTELYISIILILKVISTNRDSDKSRTHYLLFETILLLNNWPKNRSIKSTIFILRFFRRKFVYFLAPHSVQQ